MILPLRHSEFGEVVLHRLAKDMADEIGRHVWRRLRRAVLAEMLWVHPQHAHTQTNTDLVGGGLVQSTPRGCPCQACASHATDSQRTRARTVFVRAASCDRGGHALPSPSIHERTANRVDAHVGSTTSVDMDRAAVLHVRPARLARLPYSTVRIAVRPTARIVLRARKWKKGILRASKLEKRHAPCGPHRSVQPTSEACGWLSASSAQSPRS